MGLPHCIFLSRAGVVHWGEKVFLCKQRPTFPISTPLTQYFPLCLYVIAAEGEKGLQMGESLSSIRPPLRELLFSSCQLTAPAPCARTKPLTALSVRGLLFKNTTHSSAWSRRSHLCSPCKHRAVYKDSSGGTSPHFKLLPALRSRDMVPKSKNT